MMDPVIGIHIFQEIEEIKLTGFNLALLERSINFKTVNLHAASGGVEISPALSLRMITKIFHGISVLKKSS